jgi:hypothetical protein
MRAVQWLGRHRGRDQKLSAIAGGFFAFAVLWGSATVAVAQADDGVVGDAVTATVPYAAPGPGEQTVLELTNRDRAAQGLAPLIWNAALARAAMLHAQRMETTAALTHQLPDEPNVAERTAQQGAHFRAVAENIAYGFSPEAIEKEWMQSLPHRRNILDARMNAVGIALVQGAGTTWAVEDFAAATPELTSSGVQQAVGAVLGKQGLTLAADGSAEQAAAVAACPQFEGGAGAGARFVVRYESAEPTKLPQPLLDAVSSGQYRQASVASCAATNVRNRDFAAYRVVVLLW